MLCLATFFLCLSLFGGFKILCLVMRFSFFKYDFKKIYKDPETRQFAIWLLITIVSLLICFFISYQLGIIDFRSIFRSIFELRIVEF